MRFKPVWNERCSEILRRSAQHYTNSEIAAQIEAATGLRFSVTFVSGGGRPLGSIVRNATTGPRRSFAGELAKPFGIKRGRR